MLAPTVTVSEILHEVRRAERVTGDGSQISGTGYTIIKRRLSPVAQLVDGGHITSEHLQSADEIVFAFAAIAGRLWVRSAAIDRVGGRTHDDTPWGLRTASAVARYQEWARAWSCRSKNRADPTLSIVISAVVDEHSMRSIAADHGIHRDTVRNRLVAGLQDYAIRAGWL